MSPGLAYLEMVENGKYNVENRTIVCMGAKSLSYQNRDHMFSDPLTRKAAARILIGLGVRPSQKQE
jgi:hypothetical protein